MRVSSQELPDCVRSVVTMGTPFSGSHTSTNAWRLFELTSGKDITRELQQFDTVAPPVPTTSIYSRTDGVVAWPPASRSPARAIPEPKTLK